MDLTFVFGQHFRVFKFSKEISSVNEFVSMILPCTCVRGKVNPETNTSPEAIATYMRMLRSRRNEQ